MAAAGQPGRDARLPKTRRRFVSFLESPSLVASSVDPSGVVSHANTRIDEGAESTGICASNTAESRHCGSFGNGVDNDQSSATPHLCRSGGWGRNRPKGGSRIPLRRVRGTP